MNRIYLRKRGKGWAVAVSIPKRLQKKAAIHFGSSSGIKKEIVRGLGTRDLAEANRRKHEVLAQIHSTLASLDRNEIPDPIELSKEYNADRDEDDFIVSDFAEKYEERHGLKAAQAYYRIAIGKAVPVSLRAQNWLEEIRRDGLKQHTIDDYQATLNTFIEWSDDIPTQDIDRHLASSFVAYLKQTPSEKTKRPIALRTVKKKITALTRFWDWLNHYEWIEESKADIWERQRRSVSKLKEERQGKRALTKEEAQEWLAAARNSRSKYSQAMIDMIILGWHIGARAEDICSLTSDKLKKDDERGCIWLHITGGKTDSNERVMPVVSMEALEVLERRLEPNSDAPLFPDVERAKRGRKRYERLQKVINKLRRETLGDKPVDFHSFRRSFSIACEKAEIDLVQWSRLMGHAMPTLASRGYNRGYQDKERIYDYIKKIDAELGELT